MLLEPAQQRLADRRACLVGILKELLLIAIVPIALATASVGTASDPVHA